MKETLQPIAFHVFLIFPLLNAFDKRVRQGVGPSSGRGELV